MHPTRQPGDCKPVLYATPRSRTPECAPDQGDHCQRQRGHSSTASPTNDTRKLRERPSRRLPQPGTRSRAGVRGAGRLDRSLGRAPADGQKRSSASAAPPGGAHCCTLPPLQPGRQGPRDRAKIACLQGVTGGSAPASSAPSGTPRARPRAETQLDIGRAPGRSLVHPATAAAQLPRTTESRQNGVFARTGGSAPAASAPNGAPRARQRTQAQLGIGGIPRGSLVHPAAPAARPPRITESNENVIFARSYGGLCAGLERPERAPRTRQRTEALLGIGGVPRGSLLRPAADAAGPPRTTESSQYGVFARGYGGLCTCSERPERGAARPPTDTSAARHRRHPQGLTGAPCRRCSSPPRPSESSENDMFATSYGGLCACLEPPERNAARPPTDRSAARHRPRPRGLTGAPCRRCSPAAENHGIELKLRVCQELRWALRLPPRSRAGQRSTARGFERRALRPTDHNAAYQNP
jgi:hypothetical protein